MGFRKGLLKVNSQSLVFRNLVFDCETLLELVLKLHLKKWRNDLGNDLFSKKMYVEIKKLSFSKFYKASPVLIHSFQIIGGKPNGLLMKLAVTQE